MSWNTAELLDRCLAALPAALGGLEAAVTVVDNASSDDSATVAARHPNVTVVSNAGNVGYARAMNQALADPDADVLIALNPDTEPVPESLATLVDRLLLRPDVALAAPRLVGTDGKTQHSVYRFPSVRHAITVLVAPRSLLRRGLGARWWAEGYSPHDASTDIDWAIGAVHVIRAAALDGRPPYDETFFMYVEDLDLCWRLSQRGWRRRLEADVSVMHVGNAAGRQAWGERRTERWLRATYAWYERTFGWWAARRWALVNAAIIVIHIVGMLPLALAGSGSRRARVRELVGILPVHVHAAMRGSATVPTS